MLFDRRTDVGGRTGDVITQTDAQYFCPGGRTRRRLRKHLFIGPHDQRRPLAPYRLRLRPPASGAITLYIDGVQDATQANTAAWNWPPAQPIELGRLHDGYWRIFNGSMDDVRI